LVESDFVVGTVGTLSAVKDQRALLQAIARLANRVPNVKAVFVGDGPLRDELKRSAGALGIADRTLFLGWRDDVAPWLHGFDAFVNCSTSEGMCNALLEAMASGLPAVATNVGDSSAMVRDGRDGMLVAPQEPMALAAALLALHNDPIRRRSIAEAARARAKDFSFRRTVDTYARFYDGLVEGIPRSATTLPAAAPA
jgi:glycosyltransferase involved in cell wall biosynthesis